LNPSSLSYLAHTHRYWRRAFIREAFFALLELLADNKQYYECAILTNGTFINKDAARRIKDLQPIFVQVSMKGMESTHDQIRGAGNYQQTVAAIEQLVQVGVRTFISFTAHRGNFREFAHVAEVGRKLKVDKVWADRHIPMGQGATLQADMLRQRKLKNFLRLWSMHVRAFLAIGLGKPRSAWSVVYNF